MADPPKKEYQPYYIAPTDWRLSEPGAGNVVLGQIELDKCMQVDLKACAVKTNPNGTAIDFSVGLPGTNGIDPRTIQPRNMASEFMLRVKIPLR